MDSFDDTKRFDPQNPAEPAGSSASEDEEGAAEHKGHLSLSQMKLDFSKKRVTPLQRRVSDRTNRFLKSYVNPPQLEQEDVNESAATSERPSSSTGVDLANFFQQKLLSTEDVPSVPDEAEENLLDYKPKKPSRKVSAGEVFRQELRASKERGALERLKQEVREESVEGVSGREAVIGEFDIPPFTSSEETEAVPLESEEAEVAEVATEEPSAAEESTNSPGVFTDEEKAHLAKIREMAPERSDPSFPFPSYLDDDLNPRSPRVEAEDPVLENQIAPEPEIQELPPFLVEHQAEVSDEPALAAPSPAAPLSDGQVLFERKPRVVEEGRSTREIYSRDPGGETLSEQAKTVWTRPETREPVSESLEQEPELEPEPETVSQSLEQEPDVMSEPVSRSLQQEPGNSASGPADLDLETAVSQSLEQESTPPAEPAIERTPRVFRRSRTSPEAALSAPTSPRENLEDMLTQPLSGKNFDRSPPMSQEPDDSGSVSQSLEQEIQPPVAEGESPD